MYPVNIHTESNVVTQQVVSERSCAEMKIAKDHVYHAKNMTVSYFAEFTTTPLVSPFQILRMYATYVSSDVNASETVNTTKLSKPMPQQSEDTQKLGEAEEFQTMKCESSMA